MEELGRRSRRFRIARLVIFGLCLVAAVALSASFWPNDDRVTPTTDIQAVEITAVGAGAQVTYVDVTPAKNDGTTFEVLGEFKATNGRLHVSTDVDSSDPVPCMVTTGTCSPYADASKSPQCISVGTPPPGTSFPPCLASGGSDIDAKRTDWGPNPKAGNIDLAHYDDPGPWSEYEAKFTIPAVHGKGYPVQSHAGYAALIVPDIEVRLNNAVSNAGGVSLPLFKATDFSMCLPARLSGFDWTYGQIPDRVLGGVDGDPCLEADWDLSSSGDSAKATAGTASADLPAQLNRDDQKTLFAGIFLGLAGASLIAVVTEAVRPWRANLASDPAPLDGEVVLISVPEVINAARTERPRPFRASRLKARRQ
jgi:hypothetical protein